MSLPQIQGLYDPAHEHDACGLGFVADLTQRPSHAVVARALEVLRRLSHRGAAGSDPLTGDGSGILLQIPHAFYERALDRRDVELPNAGDYGVAQVFLSRDATLRHAQMRVLEDTVRYHNQKIIAWRDVPIDPRVLGPLGRASQPMMRQMFIGRVCEPNAFERTLFMIRKRAGRLASQLPRSADLQGEPEFYLASCSSKTVVYKGLALPERLGAFYLDLQNEELRSSLAVVHSRFSTNTFPTWERAHPYRRIAHNGEINTLRGNQTWMSAREPLLQSDAFREHLNDFKPIIRHGGSDSASLDNVVDFLVAGGRSIAHVMMMLVPEAWATQRGIMAADKLAFYEYHASLVEPWDGPAALVFTDGTVVGATLDRNGLRPAKYVVTDDGLVVLASEFGVLDIDPARIAQKGRLVPGELFLVDTAAGRIVSDDEVKKSIATRHPYSKWVDDNKIELKKAHDVPTLFTMPKDERERLQRAFGYTREDVKMLLAPMAKNGEEPTGSMGTDAPLAVLSTRPQLLFRYFKQQFAQVTNPPIDPIREELVMSLVSCVGGEGNLLDQTASPCKLLELPHPILTNDEIAQIKADAFAGMRVAVVSTLFDVNDANVTRDGSTLEDAIARLCSDAEQAVDDGASIVVLSDRGVSESRVAIPSLLATAAVHHSLLAHGLRIRAGVLIETGEAREVADIALLLGYGAGAVNPYLAFETIHDLANAKLIGDVDAAHGAKNYTKALKKGLLKVMSKMGISTLSSYQGAQIFEAIGIGQETIDRYFAGTSSRIGGIGLREIERETMMRHRYAFRSEVGSELDAGGVYAWRSGGETHLWNPASIASLQKSVRLETASDYAAYAKVINEQTNAPVTLRGLWDFEGALPEIAIEDVEPAVNIVKRFATGAMSFGSIGKEAHETLAIAMNRIGGKSNSGEGGEDEARFAIDENGDSRRSAIKQVASARFGVTAHYLVNADELQIKIAQGAKPGEGGQLPGHKVDDVIARVRHSTPGVTLISPPPHHDIYSIEDLAQLIFDLKSVNTRARVSVKLVSEAGVGTIAAGVAKADADAIHIAGHDGGTGASPLSSIQHAGAPWELGLAETQQVLVLNGLRGRVRIQVDGQLKTGRDVAFAALLGAEEFGFATAPLVAMGCVMMRKCHLNTCPVGIATQDPILRARFRGAPEHVINYLFFVAEELRQIMARLGFRTIDEMVGRTECIIPRRDIVHEKATLLDFSRVLRRPSETSGPLHAVAKERRSTEDNVDDALLEAARMSLKYGESSSTKLTINNSDRAFGAILAGEIARKHGADGLREGTVVVEVEGTAGQSFGAFAVRGMLLVLEGDANDYVGKGLSGGVIAIMPPARARFRADENVIVGNTVLYGATSGRAFFAGRAGERFAVRNSGAIAVVEGIGDHGCEYMTGGTVVVLGKTGRNFGAGMTGGIAYVLDEAGTFEKRVNDASITTFAIGADDDALLRALIEEHAAHTRSQKANELLADWNRARTHFVKIVPKEIAALATKRAVLRVVS